MASSLLPAALAALLAGAGEAAPPLFDAQGRAIGAPLSERTASYRIEARLDPAARVLEGREWLTWTNRSGEPQRTPWFHLYWNAFKNERSVYMRELRERGESKLRKREDWGYQDVTSIKVGGREIVDTLRFEHPDEPPTTTATATPVPTSTATPTATPTPLQTSTATSTDAGDQTVFKVTLPEPVPPGGTVTIDIAWTARVPELVDRAGRHGDFFMLGQWFPKIGVLEPAGVRGAQSPRWNCHAYHADTEFYADFGTYDVSLTVPSSMVVGASGVMVEKRAVGGTTTWRFHQDDVHDFAWTAWEGYRVVEDAFRAPGLPEVKLTLLLHPEHEASRRQYLEAIKTSLERFGRWWLPFPYPHLTLVDPPESAREAGGVEYPTFITLLTTRHPLEPRDYMTWMVTAHELGHNYWYGILASNEFEEAWLDEGVTSYGAGQLLLAEGVPLDPAALLPRHLRSGLEGVFGGSFTELDLLRFVLRGDFASPVATPGWKFKSGGDYGLNNYARTEANLTTLERLVGAEAMSRILQTYAQRWKFRHPTGADFFAVVNEVAGEDYGWFFDEFFRGTDRLDYGVESLRCREEDPRAFLGLHDRPGGERGYVGEEKAEPAPKGAPVPQRCRAIITRYGGARAPLDIRVTFDDGRVEDLRWELRDQAGPRWKRLDFLGPSKVAQVELDPARKLLIDEDRANDSRTREADGRVAGRFLGWLAYALGLVLSAFSSLL